MWVYTESSTLHPRMPFTINDRNTLLHAYTTSVDYRKHDYEQYFCEQAVDYYANVVENRKDEFLQQFAHLLSKYPHPVNVGVPINVFETYRSKDKEYQEELEASLGKPGAYFESPSGLHRASMFDIFKTFEFEELFNARVAGAVQNIYVTMTSTIKEKSSKLTVFENTLWLNFDVRG